MNRELKSTENKNFFLVHRPSSGSCQVKTLKGSVCPWHSAVAQHAEENAPLVPAGPEITHKL